MSWYLLLVLTLAIALSLLLLMQRRVQIRRDREKSQQLTVARERGSDKARLQHPYVDLSRCIGCGTCIKACPEDGVLELIHGQAVIVHGARCVGHGLCAEACPVAGIALTLGDIRERNDLPALNDELEVVGVPGLFIAGELGGFALVRTAVTQGTSAANAVAKRAKRVQSLVTAGAAEEAQDGPSLAGQAVDAYDVIVIGAGPAGLACTLRAKELGLNTLTIDQIDRLGGTVAQYPRKKLVMTQPMDLPLYGRLKKLSYFKEELIDLWEEIAREQRLSILLGVRAKKVERIEEDEVIQVETNAGSFRGRNVVMSLGRRGTPRKLGVPGEDKTKVAYSLIDAESYKGRHLLVVGGGDSAIEAAVGLAEQEGNTVTLSYRKHAFFRLKARNEDRITQAIADKKLQVFYESHVLEILDDHVRIALGKKDDAESVLELPNDDVFVFAGGIAPFSMLQEAGVSLDPKDRPAEAPLTEEGTGLVRALSFALAFTIMIAAWAIWNRGYYSLDAVLRPVNPDHSLLGPKGTFGLWAALLGSAAVVANLAYLLRRSFHIGHFLPGTLKAWMSMHVFTGIFAFLAIFMHSALSPKDTVGGHAFLAFAIVIVTGSIGRYLYSFLPRRSNGAELGLVEARARLAKLSGEWDSQARGFGTKVRAEIEGLVEKHAWHKSFFRRIGALIKSQIELNRTVRALRIEGKKDGIPAHEVSSVLLLARKAHSLSLTSAHYEDMRAVMASWRYLHRWLALLMVLLAIIHIVTAVRFGQIDWSHLFSIEGAK